MERQLEDVIERVKLVHSRRNTEGNAFSGDVQTLKKKVQEMEKELKRLKMMVDEEKTEELIRNLQKGDGQGINEEELEQLKEEINKVEAEVNEAKRFKISNKD